MKSRTSAPHEDATVNATVHAAVNASVNATVNAAMTAAVNGAAARPRAAHNVASILDENARKRGAASMFVYAERAILDDTAGDAGIPARLAAARRVVTWAALADAAARCAAGLAQLGVHEGDRVVVFLPMSPQLYTVLAAVQRIGAIPVVLESWVGRAHLERGLASVAPKALVAPAPLLAMCASIPRVAAIPLQIAAALHDDDDAAADDDDTAASGPTLAALLRTGERAAIVPMRPGDTGLITFTTGSSGTPKGANRTHAFLRAQHEAIDKHLAYDVENDVDLPVFPIFCLNSAAAGVTTVLPAVDAGHPSDDDAALLAAQIEAEGVTCTTLNPGLLRALARFCIARGRPLASLRRVAVGGAPVGPDDVALCQQMAPRATLEVLYGSTEVEPICHIGGDELVAAHARAGAADGVCAGHPTPGLAVKLLVPTRASLVLDERGFAPLEADPGDPGEIVVAGAHVCGGYWQNDDAFARAKIRDDAGVIWHRTGDVGRFDHEGRLWIVGRVHTAVRRGGAVIFPVGVECALRALPFVSRAAYVGVPDATLGERAVVAIEPHEPQAFDPAAPLASVAPVAPIAPVDWRAAVVACCDSCGVPVDDVVFLTALPMDARHHSKVEVDALRELLLHRAGAATAPREEGRAA